MSAAAMVMMTNKPAEGVFGIIIGVATALVLVIGLCYLAYQMDKNEKELDEFKKRIGLDK